MSKQIFCLLAIDDYHNFIGMRFVGMNKQKLKTMISNEIIEGHMFYVPESTSTNNGYSSERQAKFFRQEFDLFVEKQGVKDAIRLINGNLKGGIISLTYNNQPID